MPPSPSFFLMRKPPYATVSSNGSRSPSAWPDGSRRSVIESHPSRTGDPERLGVVARIVREVHLVRARGRDRPDVVVAGARRDEGDLGAVGRPLARVVMPRRREGALVRAGGVHDPDVEGAVPEAREDDRLAVRRPVGIGV